MTYIEKISYHVGRKDQVPNQDLAKLLCETEHQHGIAEIASYLQDDNQTIQSNCLKVLYEIGYINPELIAGYAEAFIKLLNSKNNRMVWGSMIAIQTISEIVPDEIWQHVDQIKQLIKTGSVITYDNGVKTLIGLSKSKQGYYDALIDDLMRLQRDCRSKDFAKIAEIMCEVIQPSHRREYLKILEARHPTLKASSQKRLAKVIQKISKQ